MLNIKQAKIDLENIAQPDYDVVLRANDKGVITVSFIDGDTHEKVNFKFNENTGVTTIAPREMKKDCFEHQLKHDLDLIKEILSKNNK